MCQFSVDRHFTVHLGMVRFSSGAGKWPEQPLRTETTRLAFGMAIKAAKSWQRLLFDSATCWVARPEEAPSRWKLVEELTKLRHYSFVAVSETPWRLPREATSSSPTTQQTPSSSSSLAAMNTLLGS